MKKAPNGVPPPPEEPGPKSGHPATQSPVKARGTRSSEPPLQVDPCRNVEDPPHTLVENHDAQWQEDNVLSHPM